MFGLSVRLLESFKVVASTIRKDPLVIDLKSRHKALDSQNACS